MSDQAPPLLSFDALVCEHQAGLRAYIRALGAQEAWVDDLAQEVFLVAYRQIDRFEAEADFGRWLRGIARRLVLNERRKHARRSRVLQASIADILLENLPEEGGRTESTASIVQALRDCVAQLPDRSRGLLQSRYAGNADTGTLAAMFHSSAAAVRQTLMRTRAAVRRCVDEKLGEACR